MTEGQFISVGTGVSSAHVKCQTTPYVTHQSAVTLVMRVLLNVLGTIRYGCGIVAE